MKYKILSKAGSCRSGNDNTGKIAHAVINGVGLCGAEPKGKSAGWSAWESEFVTCEKCKAEIINEYNKGFSDGWDKGFVYGKNNP